MAKEEPVTNDGRPANKSRRNCLIHAAAGRPITVRYVAPQEAQP